jgi:hypothetical protein
MKMAKLQSLKGKYESLKMNEDEKIVLYMQRVNELVCNIRCVSGELDEVDIIAKVLRSLPTSYKHKVSTIEEIWMVTNVTKDMLVGNLIAFELSDFGDSFPKSEFAFKATFSEKDK